MKFFRRPLFASIIPDSGKVIAAALPLLLMAVSGLAQIGPAINWQSCFGGTSNDYGPRIASTPDDGFVMLASTSSNNGDVTGNHGNYDSWAAKFDSLGMLEWKYCYGGSAADYASDIIPTVDGGYLLEVYANSNNGQVIGSHGGSEIWVVKTDSLGELLWQRPLGGSTSEIPGAIIELPDSNILVCGYALSNDGNVSGNHGGGDAWVVKLNPAGDIIWQKCFGGPQADMATDIILLENGNYLAAGYTFSNSGDVSGNHGGQDAWAFLMDTAGTLIWQHCYGGSENEYFSSLGELQSNIYLAGTTRSNDKDVSGNHGLDDYWMVRIDPLGNLLQQKCFGGVSSDVLSSYSPKSYGGFVLCGESTSNDGDVIGNHNPGTNDGWLMRADSGFNLLWSRCYGSSSVDFGFRVTAHQNRLLVGGATGTSDGDISCVQDGLLELWVFQTGKECEIPVTALFSYVQDGLEFYFTDESNQAESWSWDFGDGTFSTEQHPVHEYAQPGIYWICVGVTDSCGFDTTCVTINTCGWAEADFTFEQEDLNYQFEDASLKAEEWHWNFGDGATSDEKNPVHQFAQPGIYTVTLIASNTCNADTLVQYINTCGVLTPGFTCTSAQLIVNFVDTSSANVNDWLWSFGDGYTSTQQNPNHEYLLPGTYTVTLVAGSDCESKSVSKSVTVCAAAKAGFTMSAIGGDVFFENTSVYGTSYHWNFGNGATSTVQEPNYFFSDTGIFNICLLAENICTSDDTCIIFHNTYSGNAVLCWQQTYSEPGTFDHATQLIFADEANEVISVGTSGKGSGTLLFENLYLLKHDESGNLVWNRNLADFYPPDYFQPVDAASDSSGNIYLLFSWQQFPLFVNDWGLMKFDSDGALLWIKQGDADKNETVQALDLHKSGSATVVGSAIGSTGSKDFFTEKIDGDGNELWKDSYDYNGYADGASDVTVTESDLIYVTGTAVADELDENERMATLTYDEEGNLQTTNIEGNDIAYGRQVETNKSGDVWVLGGSSYFGDDPLVYLQRIGDNGWFTEYSAAPELNADVMPISLGVDSSDHAYVAVQLEYKDENNIKQLYPVLLKFDPSGNLVWEKTITGTYLSENLAPGFVLKSIATNAAGKTAYTGYSKPAQDANSAYDMETGRISSAGVTDWLDRLDQVQLADYAVTVAYDEAGNILVGGRTESIADVTEMIALKYCIECQPVDVLFSLAQDTICIGSGSIALPDGFPSGGIFSGDGVIGNFFFPDVAGIGLHQISYTVSDADQCIFSDSVAVVVDVCTGMENVQPHLISVSPNPFFSSATIRFSVPNPSEVSIDVLDATGKVIATVAQGTFARGSYTTEWNRMHHAAGVYFIRFRTDKSSTTLKVVAQ